MAPSRDRDDASDLLTDGTVGRTTSVPATPARQIVFIDAAVPDAAILSASARPDVRVVILSAAVDGLAQIAGHLASHGLHGLAGIDVVAHGSDATLHLGDDPLNAAGIAGHASALAVIGAALQPGGGVRLYSCNVAADAPGVAFVTALSAAAGGVPVAAASGLVGSAAGGGNWALDVATAPIAAPGPFCHAALSAYPHTLSKTPVALFYTADSAGNPQDNGLGEIDATGTVGSLPSPLDVGFNNDGFAAEGVAIDAARGEYAFAYYPDGTTSTLVIGHLAGGGGTTLTVGDLGLAVGSDFIDGVAIDEPAGELYLAISSDTASHNGIWAVPETGGQATAVATSTSLSNPTDLALDSSDGLIFFVDQSVLPGISPAANNLDVATVANGTIQTLFTGSTSSTAPQISGLAVDAADRTIYYTTHDSADTASANSIVRVSYTIETGSSVVLGHATTLYAGSAAGEPFGIALDVPDGVFYVENGLAKTIEEGSLTGAFTLTAVSNATIGSGGVATDGEPEYLAVDVAPTITAGGTVSDPQGASIVLADASATDADPNGADQAGATVRIAGGTFSGDGDRLAAITIGTSITATYAAATETLTLTGVDSAAHYAQVLDSVAFSTSAGNPTDSGADPTRTLDWTITDGLLSSAVATSAVSLACFLAGTCLLSDRGPVPVEALRPGDRLVTQGGGVETVEPIIWIGQRALDAGRHPRPEEIRPIRIRAEAIGPGQPARDVFLSPDHAVFIDGVLVAARQLANGTSIAQDSTLRRFTYYHVELPLHAVVLAEGLPVESYLDSGNRSAFVQDDATMLHPDLAATAPRGAPGRSCAPFAVDAEQVRPIWQRLAVRADAWGEPPPLCAWTDEPELRLDVDGRRLRPIASCGDRVIFAVPPGARCLRLLSRAAAPNTLRPWLDDRRRLGVAVRAIVVERDGVRHSIPLDHPALNDGWWDIEGAGGERWRWTDGAARLPCAGMVDIRLHRTGNYPIAASPSIVTTLGTMSFGR